MAHYFITGGGGFIGSRVVRKLLNRRQRVTIYDSFTNYVYPLSAPLFYNIQRRLDGIEDKVELIRSSVEHYDFLRKSIEKSKPDVVIHLAAMPLANMAITHPDEAVITIMNGTVNVLRAAQNTSSVRRIVYISSSMVYGDFGDGPVTEDHPKSPKEVYGALKLAGEVIVQSYCGLYDREYVIVRPSAVYGPGDNNRRVLGIFLENALSRKPLKVNGADSALDFTFVDDTAEGIVLAAVSAQAAGHAFNITRGEGRTIGEAARIVQELVPGTRVELGEAEAWRPKRGALDITKARKLLDYNPKFALEDGLKAYLAYLTQQQSDLKTFSLR